MNIKSLTKTNLQDLLSMWLRRNKGDWVTVVRETEINYFWLSKLARGKIPNPGYRNLHILELYVIKVEKAKKAKKKR